MAIANLPAACAAALERHLKPELFKALCDPRRLALLAELAVAPQPTTVSDAASCCGVHLSGVSRHLSILRDAGVVTATKHGREVAYQVNFREVVATLRGLADALEDCCTTVGCCGAPNPTQETEP
jgi:DNA-binding transcriptional ArsR family regulator